MRAPDRPERVLVVAALPSGTPPRRPRRRARPRRAAEAPPTLPIQRVTVVETGELDARAAAERWLRQAREDETGERLVRGALAVLNRALHATALAAADPHAREVGAAAAITVRVGFGTGDDVAASRWAEAIELPGPALRRARRAGALRADERFAAIIGGREEPAPAETLLLRARADLEAERPREFALQLQAAVDALVAELGEAPDTDLEALAEATRRSAQSARIGPLADAQVEELEQVLESLERALRRKRFQ